MAGKNTMERAQSEAQGGPKGGWLTLASRAGYAAKGVVYATIGLLALLAAFGMGGGTTDSRGAIDTLVSQPFGTFIVGFVALGLLCYAAYRVIAAACDEDNDGHDGKGIAKRIAKAVAGFVYLSLAVYAAGFLFDGFGLGGGGGGGGNRTADLTAQLMSFPFGRILVGVAGLVAIAVSFHQFKKAYTKNFLNKLAAQGDKRRTMGRVGQIGFAARGIVFIIIGGFLIVAAWQADPQEARGLDGALQTLLAQPWGNWLLGLVALGLIAYAAYAFCVAAYRRTGGADTKAHGRLSHA